MTRKRFVGWVAVAALILFNPLVALGQGRGGGGGGSGGGGGGVGGGGSTVGSAAGALYGDLYIIERDGNGEPVLRSIEAVGGPYICQQPLAADCSFLGLNGDQPGFNPEEDDACGVIPDDAPLLQAVTFGRESVSRAPATVLDHAYGEALNNINAASKECDGRSRAMKLDPAGRIELCLQDESTGLWAWKTIDAPLENLGLYRAVMTEGCLAEVTDEKIGEEGVRITVTYQIDPETGDPPDLTRSYLRDAGLGHLICVDGAAPTPDKNDLLSAAVFIAAGADKFVPVSLDQIINVNNSLGVNVWTYTTSKKVKTLNIAYFQFKLGEAWFTYTKGVDACVVGTTEPDNIVPLLVSNSNPSVGTYTIGNVDVFAGSPPGVKLTDVTVCRRGEPLAYFCDDSRTPYSPPDSFGCGGANWFTQAAEHARKTIWYLHNYEPPEDTY